MWGKIHFSSFYFEDYTYNNKNKLYVDNKKEHVVGKFIDLKKAFDAI